MLLVVVYFRGSGAPSLAAAGRPVGVQPSELAKPALVIFLAFFVTWRARAINNRATRWSRRRWPSGW